MVISVHKKNNNIVKDVTPFPDQDMIHLDIAQAKIQLKLDFLDIYEQVQVEPEDMWKTTFVTVQGVYKSLVMQQGGCNALSTFQWLMNHIFQEYISIFMHAYLNDIFVFSNSIEKHQRHLKLVFDKICEHELYLKEEMCEFYAKRVECLSHIIDEKGLHMDSDKMARI